MTAAALVALVLTARRCVRRCDRCGYRYNEESVRVVDGALFVFAQANDAEALLQLEVVRETESNELRWKYTIARLNSSKVTVRLDNAKIVSTSGYWENPRSLDGPYLVVNEGAFAIAE